MNHVYHAFICHNVAGIDINLGYYALAECLIKGTNPADALLRWCDLRIVKKERKPYTSRPYVAPDKKVNERVLQIYRENPNLTNTEIAKLVNRSKSFVSIVLKSIGVKRNRWDTYKKGKN